MKWTRMIGLASALITLTACAPINTKFSCNETAKDRCLSIEEVHAMTERSTYKIENQRMQKNPSTKHCKHCQKDAIWFAPWKDKQGKLHEGDVLFADLKINGNVSL